MPLIDDGRVQGVVVIWHDVTERIRLEGERGALVAGERAARDRAKRAADRAERLQEVATTLAEAFTPAQVADVILAQGMAALGAHAGVVALLAVSGIEMEPVPLIRGNAYHRRSAHR